MGRTREKHLAFKRGASVHFRGFMDIWAFEDCMFVDADQCKRHRR